MTDRDSKPENIAAALAEREMDALRDRERCTDDQVAQRWACGSGRYYGESRKYP